MNIIDHQSIINLGIGTSEFYEWVEEMLINKETAILPPKISMKPTKHIFYNTMPSIIPKYNIAGVKVVSRYPNRIPALDSQILLYDLEKGNLKALLDGNYITAMRTGAVAAFSIELLAIKEYKTIAMIGLGNTARATFKILVDKNKDRELTIKLYDYKNRARNFANEFEKYKNVRFEIYDSYDKVISGSDVVISCVTYAKGDFCSNHCYKEGCLVVPVHTLGFQNCDLFFDKVFADDINHVKGFKYFDKFKKLAEISEVVTGKKEGRKNEKERILAYNIGISLHDIFFAQKIYELIGDDFKEEVELNAPKEKFWV
ncbi:ornithine cyclodeaminase [Oceanirhabdus sp. W0125-5]|uniref:ornithine cyclodeaminase n=1 Tax=Oceanirhabdus sp. W0125-5 TaxID=2999116 RepID=UPI0022F32CEE|nr:ornithine cyclodeaminase [Oceanirhabdus sp. W0125-5]WBW98669.1 ornithine cyclodeaminase [Oceanirhabdus sp. W0125-5]